MFCRSDADFKHDKEGKLAGPTLILPASGRGPTLKAKTVTVDQSLFLGLFILETEC